MINKIGLIILFFSNVLCCNAEGAIYYSTDPGELYTIAENYSNIGNYAKAVPFYKRTIECLGKRDSILLEQILIPYSKALTYIGSYDTVDTLLSSKRYQNNYYLLNNRASALGYKQDYANALAIFNRILSLPNLSKLQIGLAYQNIGFILMDMKSYSVAAENFQKSIDSLNEVNILIAKSNLALCLANLGKFRESIILIDEVIRLLSNQYPTYHEEYIICLRKKAEIYSLFDKKKEAYSYFKSYYDLNKDFIIKGLSNLSNNERLNLWLKEKPLLSKCFILENYAPEFLFDVALFRRQTSLLGVHNTDSLKSILSSTSSDIRKSLGQNESAIEFVSYTSLDGKIWYAAIIMPKKGSAKFVKLFDEDFIYQPEVVGTNSLINAIKRDDHREKNILYTDSILAGKIWSPIIAALPNNTSKIYFAPEGVLHFLGIENMPFKGKEHIELHRVSSTANIAKTINEPFQTERTLLVGGLDYSSMPIDSFANTFSHEAADLLSQKAGNTNVFQYLPGTRSEVDSIHAIINNSFITYQIGEANLKQELPKFDIIHIATHGYSLNLGIRKRPEFAADSLAYDIFLNATGLALSGANVASMYSDREDGILSAREICDLDLSNVDFVILSACQTAQGDITDEGAAGLVRGLKNAGVKTVLATLWSVDDKSTMLFMQEFYRLLHDGKTKHEAYLGAQDFLKKYEQYVPLWKFSPKTLSKEREPHYITIKYDAPYYWAPFIIIDDF